MGATRRRGRPRGLRLQDRLKLFVGSVLLGMAGGDALGRDAQLDPPDAEPRQPRGRRARKRRAVIAANALRQPIVGKRARETATRRIVRVAGQRIASQHVTTEAVAQRERMAGDAVARARRAFEIRRPRAIGRGDRRQWWRERETCGPPAPRRAQAAALEGASVFRVARALPADTRDFAIERSTERRKSSLGRTTLCQ